MIYSLLLGFLLVFLSNVSTLVRPCGTFAESFSLTSLRSLFRASPMCLLLGVFFRAALARLEPGGEILISLLGLYGSSGLGVHTRWQNTRLSGGEYVQYPDNQPHSCDLQDDLHGIGEFQMTCGH